MHFKGTLASKLELAQWDLPTSEEGMDEAMVAEESLD